MSQTQETLLFSVDVAVNDIRLAELRKELLANQESLAKYNKAAKDGRISLDELAIAEQRLKADSANLNQEIKVLTKANAQQDAANKASAGSLEQLRAQYGLAAAALAKLSADERDNTEAGQKLQAQTKALNDELLVQESRYGQFGRNVGNYKGAIDPLIAQLVKLEEQQKLAAPNSEEYARAAPIIKGFQQAINDNAIKAGLSQDALNAKYEKSAEAIRPAVAALVELEEEQKKVEKGTDAYTAIGFKIGQAAKEVDKAVAEVAKAPEAMQKTATVTEKAAETFGKLGDVATKLPGPLGQTVGGLAATGQGLLTATKAALAFIATPLGLFLAAVTAAFYVLKEAFTATDDGQENLAAGMAALNGVLGVLKSAVIDTGNFLVKLFTNPIEAGKQLLDFFEGQIVNRVKAYGVIFNSLASGDFKGATNGVLQLATGVENVVGKAQELTGEFRRAATAAVEISRAKDELENLEIDAIARGEKQRQQAERLVLTAKDRNLTEAQRLKNLDEASRLEKAVLDDNLRIERERLRIIQLENSEAERRGVLQDSERRAEQEQVARLEQLQGEYEKAEQARANRRSVLQEAEATARAAAAKKAADERQKALEDEIKGRITATELALASVKVGSGQELALKEQLVAQKAELEQAGEKKTAADRKLILVRSLAEILKLDEEFDQKRQENARKFLDAQLSRDQAALAAEKKRRDDAAKEAEDDYARNERLLQRNLDRRAATLEQDYAEGKVSKEHYEQSLEILEENSLGARIVLQKQFNKDSAVLETQLAKVQGNARRTALQKDKETNKARLDEALQFGKEVGQLFADTLSDTGETLQEFAGKVLILILDSLEKTVLASQAEAAAKSIAENPTPAGFVQAAVAAAAIQLAFEGVKAAISATTAKPFNTGGIVGGALAPGTPNRDTELTYLTKGEIVLSQGVASTFPELPPVLGYLNSLAGGVNFAPGFTPQRVASATDGGLTARAVGNAAQPVDYGKLTQALERANLVASPSEMGAAIAKRARTQARVTLGG